MKEKKQYISGHFLYFIIYLDNIGIQNALSIATIEQL